MAALWEIWPREEVVHLCSACPRFLTSPICSVNECWTITSASSLFTRQQFPNSKCQWNWGYETFFLYLLISDQAQLRVPWKNAELLRRPCTSCVAELHENCFVLKDFSYEYIENPSTVTPCAVCGALPNIYSISLQMKHSVYDRMAWSTSKGWENITTTTYFCT